MIFLAKHLTTTVTVHTNNKIKKKYHPLKTVPKSNRKVLKQTK